MTDLLQPMYGWGHHVYMENYFGSPSLFEELQNNQVGACRTLGLNRIGIPAEAAEVRLGRGEQMKITWDGTFIYISWKDDRQVNILSTIHNESTFQKKVRC